MIGVYGSSSGGHVAELLGMRPRDARYNAIPLPEAPNIDATVAYIATRSPISNTYARFQNAEEKKRDNMIKNNKTFFKHYLTTSKSTQKAMKTKYGLLSLFKTVWQVKLNVKQKLIYSTMLLLSKIFWQHFW